MPNIIIYFKDDAELALETKETIDILDMLGYNSCWYTIVSSTGVSVTFNTTEIALIKQW